MVLYLRQHHSVIVSVCLQSRDGSKVSTKHYVSDASPSKSGSIVLRVPSPTALSPIESAAERLSDLSGLHNQRDSYYHAVHDDYLADDDCMSEVKIL